MGKIIKFISLQSIFLVMCFIFYYYSPHTTNILFNCLELFIPISGTSIFLLLISSRNNTSQKINYFILILFLIGLDFGMREFVISPPTPQYTGHSNTPSAPLRVILKEFDQLNQLPIKKGMIIQNNIGSYSFGLIAQQNAQHYLLQNIFFSALDKQKSLYSLYAQYGKIIDNKLILYHATLFTYQNNILTPDVIMTKNYQLPLSFDITTLFNLWNVNSPQEIKLLPVLSNFHYLKTFFIPVWVSFSHYISALLTLIIILTLGIACQNTLSFKGVKLIGSMSLLICIFPIITALYYYISVLMQALIYLI